MIDETDSLSQSLLHGDSSNPGNFTIFADEGFEPCRVCGEPSSGWHCGAVTCEACKKFFLRSINGEDAKYKCVRNRDCVIARATRTQCQYCRYKKCKEVGMTINENPNNPTVAELFKGIPCSVCKASSSGVHFGAITCEGCKGFFRRTIKERVPERYKCMDNGNCEVSVATRNMCRYCRYQKCLQAEMSANKSRIGRQSNLFKHQIIELQRRGYVPNSAYLTNVQRKIKSSYNKMAIKNDPFSGADDFGFLSGHDPLYTIPDPSANYLYNNQVKSELYSDPNTDYVHQQQQQQQQGMQTPDLLNDFYPPYQSQTQMQQSDTSTPTHALYHDTTQMATAQQQLLPLPQQQQQQQSYHPSLDSLFDKHTCDYIRTISKLFTEFKNDLISTTTNITNELYNYDNDFDLVMEVLRLNSVKFLKFAENLPDMAVLSIDDQNELIKHSIHSIILLVLQAKCNFLNYFNCEELILQKFLKIFPIFMRSCDFMKHLREDFLNLKLDDVEYALFAAVVIMSPGKTLTRFDKVTEIRDHLSNFLHKYMMARRNEDSSNDNLLLMLTGLRKFNLVLQNGLYDSYQHLIRKELKAIRSFPYFSRVYLPKNVSF